jgi:RNA polymerase sigma-70 factor (family 1)
MMPVIPAAESTPYDSALRAGDADAYRAFFDAVYAPLRAYALSIVRDESAADDLVQEAFVRLWDRRAQIEPQVPLRAYVYRTVRNLALNDRRDLANRARLLAEPDALNSAASPRAMPAADSAVEARELEVRLTAMIADLPPRQREALQLSRVEGLTHAEVSATMGCSPRTVNNHLVSALATLRRRLADAGSLVAAMAWWIS